METQKSHFTLAHEEYKPSPPPPPPSAMEDDVGDLVDTSSSSQQPVVRKNKYEGRTNNLVKLVRITGSGDLFAIAHPHKKTGYKCRNAYGHRPVFQDETTNYVFQTNVFKNTPEVLRKKKLLPYHPNAPCNRNPETYRNTVGTHCNDCRDASYLSLYDGVPKHLHTPKTTNQLFMNYKLDLVGNANHAIFADKAKRMHRLQVDG